MARFVGEEIYSPAVEVGLPFKLRSTQGERYLVIPIAYALGDGIYPRVYAVIPLHTAESQVIIKEKDWEAFLEGGQIPKQISQNSSG